MGPSVPRAGNAVTRAFARAALRVGGWRIEGEVPDEPKLVLVGAPHTTNWDFLLTKLTAGALGVRLFWVGKQSLFPRWLAPFARRLGGIPVDRASSEGFVDAMVAEFRRRDRFYLALMPAGSRSTPDSWRSGFYYIARDAGVPLFLVGFDWGARTMRLGPILHARPGDSYEDEVARIRTSFEGLTGRHGRAGSRVVSGRAVDVRERRAR
jgi:1-acyl-sn-glycerol-3-phosphate acyltransferase